MKEPQFRSQCALSSALDLVGDKWSLLILRSMFVGASRYRDFLNDPEGISTNILADRLKRLECSGIIESVRRGGERHYRLTRRGADLLPTLQELSAWGHANIAERWAVPEWFARAKPADFYPNPEGEKG